MADPRRLAEQFTEEFRGAAGARLQAASLFGSVTRDEWIEGVSDVNVVVLVDALDAALINQAAPAVRHALEQGVTPLVMELDEWRRAADVFSIELADMKECSAPLFGDDPAAGASIDPVLLRLQAERELRARLLHLHAGMLVAADDPARLGTMLVRALPSFTTYMRAALRLAGRPVPRNSRGVIEAACALADADAAPFLEVLDARTAGGELVAALTDPLPDQFNRAATRLASYIDAFGR
jgi:predicted nucleotidyltransferase